ncbi:MAG: energy transducer TonB [Prevotellaceae bacterium]|jgi:TonB family protein|nr:energy transducer TonB [Prevotellaceae bacterium]
MDNFPFVEEKQTLGQWVKEHQSGLYLTVIFHLIIFILMALQGIQNQMVNESVFIFDFSRQEAEQARKEQEIKEQEEKKEIEREVDEMIQQTLGARETPRNVAVNTVDRKEVTMKSSLGESKTVFDEAKAMQERLDATRQKIEELKGSDDISVSANNAEDKQENKEMYTGPSVLSYTLEGRRAVSLPVPVYKCPGGGDVTVSIEVNRNGYVVDVSVQTKISTDNDCLHEAARDAAKRSRFNADASTPEKQKGEIVYRFIAQ